MIRKLLLLLVILLTAQFSHAGQGELLANCFYDSYNQRIVIRIALRNKTGSNSEVKFVGMRFGFQYNALAVTYTGYTSYMDNGGSGTGLDDASYLSFIGADTGPSPAVGTESPSTRDADILTGGSKTMQLRYINRTTDLCANANIIGAGETKVLLDIYFDLVNDNPQDYHLNDGSTYGFGDPEFIAQFLTHQNGGEDGDLIDSYKEIAILCIRNGNTGNPYQPFDMSNCSANGNVNPTTVGGDDINFISPANGILSGKAIDAILKEKDNNVLVQWKSENNQLIDYFEVQRKENSGEFKTIGLVMSTDDPTSEQYEFKDKITTRDVESSYRVKVINKDKVITYSDVKKIRLGSEQGIIVKVFPNPSSEILRINLPDGDNSTYVCRMYSTEGRMVQVTNVSSNNPSVNIRSLTVGSYFMELYHPKSGKRFYTQFSKQ